MADGYTAFLQARAMFEMARDDAGEDVESDVEFALLDSALCDASRDLFKASSPDFSALAYKLQIFLEEEIYHARSGDVREILEAMISDMGRLIEAGAEI